MNKSAETILLVERVIKASPHKIFEALTNESLLRQWFYPKRQGFSVEVEYNAREGGAYRIDMIDAEGTIFTHQGMIKELIPDKKISFTWNSHAVNDTLVTIWLQEKADGTKITLKHDFNRTNEMEGHEEGWKELLENLNILLTNE